MIVNNRLELCNLENSDNVFIMELLNTDGWIHFIGDRNIHTLQDADKYIQKIKFNQNINYWVVKHKETKIPLGIVSFIKRDYLDHHDIGFAFLPQFSNQGFAFEAVNAVLEKLVQDDEHSTILATTIPENIKSITLLLKLGFIFEKQIENDGEKLGVYRKSFIVSI